MELSAQKNAAALEQLLKGLRAHTAQPPTQALVGDRTQLLGHREAVLSQATLGSGDCKMQGATEIGSSERHGK